VNSSLSLSMNYVTDYKIIYAGKFTEEDFHIDVKPGLRKYKAYTRQLINEAWEEAKLNPSLDIFNGKVYSLLSIFMTVHPDTGKDHIFLKVQQSDYKSFYGTNVCNSYRLPKTELANALAVCAVVETTDGMVFTGLRSIRLAETSGVWHLPGGTFNEIMNPIAVMTRELSEELNIDGSDILSALCLGFGENLVMQKPEFFCYFHLRLSQKQLSQKMLRAQDKDEHTETAFVPLEELLYFSEIHPFAPMGRAAINLYLDYILHRGTYYA
jgi:8-oxo-dGTP pyrophosphatase MutT (NUDIX family)